MKQTVILILFATLFVACNNDAHDEDPIMPDLTQIGIKAKPAKNSNMREESAVILIQR